MKFRNVFFLFFLALLASCTRDAMQDEAVIVDNQEMMRPSGSEDGAVMFRSPHLNGKAVERTLTMRNMSGKYTYEPPGTGYCPEYFKFTSRGNGEVTHLGSSSFLSYWCVTAPIGSPVGVMNGSIKAANGDKIYGEVIDHGWSEVYPEYYYFHFLVDEDKSTGRFSGAEGSYKIYIAPEDPLLDPQTGILTGIWTGFGEGTITY